LRSIAASLGVFGWTVTQVPQVPSKGVAALDLFIWIPAMVVLGLFVLALLFAFVFACDKV
jgi:hypothetical protein